MTKAIGIAFARTGSRDPFKRLQLIESIHKATFGRKSLMDFCFVSLEHKENNLWISTEGNEFRQYSDGGKVYFIPTPAMKIEGSDRKIESVVLLNDFVKYLELLIAGVRYSGLYRRSGYFQNWISFVEEQRKMIADHLKAQYGVSILSDDEKNNEGMRSIIVRDEPVIPVTSATIEDPATEN